jgi:hypothetical protein
METVRRQGEHLLASIADLRQSCSYLRAALGNAKGRSILGVDLFFRSLKGRCC